jgi:hypothetical protein
MIPGIVASIVQGPGAANWDLNFVTGTYKVSGSTVSISTLVDRPQNIFSGMGLIVATHPIVILGDLLDFLLAGDWTVVVDWVRPDAYAEPLRIADASDNNPRIGVQDDSGGFLAYELIVGTRDLDLTGKTGTIVRSVIAFTRNDVHLAISRDSATVVEATDPGPLPLAMSGAWFGGGPDSSGVLNSSGQCLVRRFIAYPSKSNATLISLSANSGAISYVAPPNDSFANAITINVDDMLVSYNYGANKETGEPVHPDDPGGASIWWKFTAPSSGNFHITLDDSDIDTLLAVYTGSAVNALTLVDSNLGFPAELTFIATSGTVYYIAVDGAYSEIGFITINLATGTAPSITGTLAGSVGPLGSFSATYTPLEVTGALAGSVGPTGTMSANFTPQGVSGTLVGSVNPIGSFSGTYTAPSAITTWNPSDKSASVSLSSGNSVATNDAFSRHAVRASAGKSSGKWGFRVTPTIGSTGEILIGIATSSASLSNGVGLDNNAYGYNAGNGTVYKNSVGQATYAPYSNTQPVDIVCDFDNNRMWVRRNNGTWNNSGTADPSTNTGGLDISALSGTKYPAWSGYDVGDTATLADVPSMPSGFSTWS